MVNIHRHAWIGDGYENRWESRQDIAALSTITTAYTIRPYTHCSLHKSPVEPSLGIIATLKRHDHNACCVLLCTSDFISLACQIAQNSSHCFAHLAISLCTTSKPVVPIIQLVVLPVPTTVVSHDRYVYDAHMCMFVLPFNMPQQTRLCRFRDPARWRWHYDTIECLLIATAQRPIARGLLSICLCRYVANISWHTWHDGYTQLVSVWVLYSGRSGMDGNTMCSDIHKGKI